MESLKHFALKIKNSGKRHFGALSSLPDEIYVSSVIILVGLAGFSLGRLSVLEKGRVPIKITYPQEAAVAQEERSPVPADLDLGGYLVASKSGAKYHFPWCAGAQQISEKNKIYFKNAEEARAAGYSPASNCKGLE